MADPAVIQKLLTGLREESSSLQASAIETVRDLASEPGYREAFCQAGALEALVGLVSGQSASTLPALQALRSFAEADDVRPNIVKAGALGNLIGLLQDKNDPESQELRGSLHTLLALAVDEPTRLAFSEANGIPVIVRLIEHHEAEDVLDMACQLLGRLGHNPSIKDSVREFLGVIHMLKLLKKSSTSARLAEVILQALTILLVDNEVNQDQVSDQYGMETILKMLDARVSENLAVAATTCLTALCLNNEKNKDIAREQWAVPLLVTNLEKESAMLVEKTVDCLRVLTSDNEANKLALFSIPAGVKSLIQIMIASKSMMMVERSAAVIGNLSTTEQFFGAIRERGGLQRLVQLLDSGHKAKVTEIAAKTLANLARSPNSKLSIRLAGGLPPLVNLLTQRPSSEVMAACEEALRRLQITDAERNAVLETLRYCDQHRILEQGGTPETSTELPNGHLPDQPKPAFNLSLTQYGVEETCALLRDIGISDVRLFEENCVTGGDLIELEPADLKDSLNLSSLQARKVATLKASFQSFEDISLTPGKGEVTSLELRGWLERKGLSLANQQAVINGLKNTLDVTQFSVLPFRVFARQYQWLNNILQTAKS